MTGHASSLSGFRSRRGFTLVELTIVILIIGVLAAFLMPAVVGSGQRGRRALTETRLHDLEAALEKFKERFGMYPPSRLLIRESGDFETTTGDADLDVLMHRSQRLLQSMWPQIRLGTWNLNRDGDSTDTFVLDGFKCLVFFLYGPPTIDRNGGVVTVSLGKGFSRNPRNPFSTGAGQRDGPFYTGLKDSDLREGADDDADSSTAIVFYEIADPINPELSLAYFSSYGGEGYRCGDCTVAGEDTADFRINGIDYAGCRGPNPYTKGASSPSGTTSAVFWRPNGVQIISAGMDGSFGRGGWFQLGDLSGLGDDDQDNLTNFAQGMLIEASAQ